MAGSRKWLRAMHGRRCETCGIRFTEFAVKELNFKLLPRGDGDGYGAVRTTLTAYCPKCGSPRSAQADDTKPADMKAGIGWLVDRTRLVINPFTKRPVVPNEALKGYGGTVEPEIDDSDVDCPSERLEEDDDESEGPGGTAMGTDPEPDAPGEPPARNGDKRGRLLTQPSIRSCCPPSPITDGTLSAAKRTMRGYADIRTKPSFINFMLRFGVVVGENGRPLDEEDSHEQ